ncbi:MATE family efflux transporter [Paenibacillus sp. sptzw28]|uniref:MATE family efflux transporter n=1 Tax=Paenibacillus sp. sptzw28 TaxID=715179 RepID=UPI001C6E239C|nr:MATE family efflux transporter [Paenibacillus sp. sptzw28]QYR19573.1 MATE family efflux transporter [Paenibacillus sp. sptzw28]
MKDTPYELQSTQSPQPSTGTPAAGRTAEKNRLSQRTYLALGLPLLLSGLTTPLLGAVDTATVGQLTDPALLGGVAVGALIFNTMYWLFGFLRVSTSGFAAQALGSGDHEKSLAALFKPALLALSIGLLFVLLQRPILHSALTLIRPGDDVSLVASQYFNIRIWGAPVTLMNYVIIGWMLGTAKIRMTLFLQIGMNVFDMGLTLLFVKAFHWGVTGVAAATTIAEATVLAAGLIVFAASVRLPSGGSAWKSLMHIGDFRKMLSVNGDLMIRTACLLSVFNLFTAAGSSFGTEQLAANVILLQIHFLMAAVFEGFANAGSIFAGKALGSQDRLLFRRTIGLSWRWALLSAVLISGIYWVLNSTLITLFTNNDKVSSLALNYSIWIAVYPFAAGLCLIFYGIFTGTTKTAPIRNSTIMSLIVFLAALYLLVPVYQNHGLWLAFLLFSLARSLFLIMYLPKLERSLFIR